MNHRETFRQHERLARTFYLPEVFFFLLIMGCFHLVSTMVGCREGLSPAEVEDLSQHEKGLKACREVGRTVQDYDAYQACKLEAGL